MKNLSIFEPQIEKHYAYKKKHVFQNVIFVEVEAKKIFNLD